MKKYSPKRWRLPSGPNVGLRRHKSNTGGDEIYNSATISNSLPRDKPGTRAIPYQGGDPFAPSYTKYEPQESHGNGSAGMSLISKTTMDILRQFRNAPNGAKSYLEQQNKRP